MNHNTNEELDSENHQWIKTIQKKSWEAEMLISGGATLVLIQASSVLAESFSVSFDIGLSNYYVLTFLLISLNTVTGGFIIHLILRGFWLSQIMLLKIFPQGIQLEKLKHAEEYMKQARSFSITKRIVSLDKTCSLIFVYSFTVPLVFAGIYVFFMVGSINSSISAGYPQYSKSITFIVVTSILIIIAIGYYLFLFDLFSGGYFRRRKSVLIQKLYAPMYRFYNTISFGFLWRPVMQTIRSNAESTIRLGFLIFIFFILSITFASFVTGASKQNNFFNFIDERRYETAPLITRDEFYQENISHEQWTGPVIQSVVVTENHIRLFVPYSIDYDKAIDSIKHPFKYITNVVTVSINDSIYRNPEWTGIVKANGQKGIITVLDIAQLRRRKHILKVIKPSFEKIDTLEIPFFKQ